MKLRRVEMYVGIHSGSGESGSWYTWDVEIPVETPEDLVPTVATAKLYEEIAQQGDRYRDAVAFTGVYHIESPDDLEEEAK